MNSQAGYYGKFPELGDFVQRRLPGSFVDGWDEWLQGSIFTSREMLGDSWLKVYLNGPIWRFCLSGGICGESPWCGLVMPSVDRVGRYFPLTLACPLPADCNLFHIGMQGQPWFNAAEEVLLGVLQSRDFNLEKFDDIVAGLGTMDIVAEYSATPSGGAFGSAWRLPLHTDGHLGPAVLGLTDQLALQNFGAFSLWWSLGSDRVEPSLLLSRDLPEPANFAGMLSGDWSSGTWMDVPATIHRQAGDT